jgi:hypothetical protein
MAFLDNRLNKSKIKITGGRKMKKKCILKAFIYFLCVSFLLMVNGFHGMVAQANQNAIPIGQMISHGGVKFEIKGNAWEKVETTFPVFEGMKVRTEKGEAVLAIAEKTRIEVGPDSLFYFDQRDQFYLLQGKINFRIQPDVQLRFKVGNLWISKSYPLQAGKTSSAVVPEDKGALGSIMIHSNGSVAVKSVQGPLYVRNQDGKVLAFLSSGESITIPSVRTGTTHTQMAQRDVAGLEKLSETGSGEFLGLSTWAWVGIGAAAVIAATIIAIVASKDEDHERPVCP